MNPRVWLSLFSVLGVSIVGARASAHIALTCPPARYAYSAQGIKTGPCGATGGTKSNKVTHLIAGQQLAVTFTETIGHPGFFRISLDTTGTEGFPAISKTPEDPVIAPVLADNILPHTTASNNVKRTATITVPTTTCPKCVLQLTQFMSDNPTSGYYECADVVIDAAGSGADFSCDGDTTGMGGKSGAGGNKGGGGSTSASGGAMGSGGDTAGSGGIDGGGSGGSSSSGGATSSSGGSSSSGGATSSSGGSSSSGGITGSGGTSSSGGSNGSGGSPSNGSGGSSSTGSGGAKGATDDGAGGCAYTGADPSNLALAASLTALLLGLRRRTRLTGGRASH